MHELDLALLYSSVCLQAGLASFSFPVLHLHALIFYSCGVFVLDTIKGATGSAIKNG